MRHRRGVGLALLAVVALVVASCDIGATFVTTPPGTIVESATATVTGQLPDGAKPGGTVTVNGVTGTWSSQTEWSADIPVDTANYVTPVTSIYTEPGKGNRYIQKSSVVHGPRIEDGAHSPDGVGMYFTNHGLEGLGPVINSLAASSFDIAEILPPGSSVVSGVDAGMGVTITDGKVYQAGAESIDLAATSTTGGVGTAITIDNLYLGLELTLSGLISGKCKLEVEIPSTTIDARFDLEPGNPADKVGVRMIGDPAVNPSGLNFEFISGVCDPSTVLLGSIINSQAAGAIEGSITGGFVDTLRDPDGTGPRSSPLADAIQTALAGISIAGSVGDAVEARLDAPFTRIDETSAGIDFRSDANFSSSFGTDPGQCVPAPGARTFDGTMDVPGAYPELGATTPDGLPYGLGLVISSSTFNQLLSAMTECGLLNQDMTEIALGDTTLSLTSTVLSLLIPEFGDTGRIPANTPLKIRLAPQAAPFITPASAGPNGEAAELLLPDLHIEFIQTVEGDDRTVEINWLTLAVDAPLGFEMGFDAEAGQLAPTITAPPVDRITARVLSNKVGADEATTAGTFAILFPNFVSDLGSGFGAFPLPEFMGLSVDVVDIARTGTNYWTLFADLTPASQPKLANVTVTDRSSSDYATDAPVFNSYEWRHRIRKQVSPDRVDVRLAGIVGADACCTVSDAFAEADAGYRIEFDVDAAPGENWQLDMGSLIRGAHVAIDEGGYGAQSNISRITSFYELNHGIPVHFDYDVGNGAGADPNETTPWQGGWSGSSFHEPFEGARSATIQGSGSAHVAFEIRFHVQAWSDANVAFPAKDGNEIAIILGANDSLTNNFTAGEYPGPGNRDIMGDGHFGTIELTALG